MEENKVYIKELNIFLKDEELFYLFKNEYYCQILDSSLKNNNLGKYSIIVFDPFLIFRSKNNNIEIEENKIIKNIEEDPLLFLKQLLIKYKINIKKTLPFIGGCVGFFSYDICNLIEKLPNVACDDSNIPDLVLGFYDSSIIIEHLTGKVYFTYINIQKSNNQEKAIIEKLKKIKCILS